jgi:transcription antitermination protein NusB
MTTRRRAREVVLQLLYAVDINPMWSDAFIEDFLAKRMLKNKPLMAFGRELLKGVRANRKDIDQTLGRHAANWSIKRMTTVDRNILRIAAYEILSTSIPAPVAINEAIELAKRYGHQNSGSFVNGILDRLYRDVSTKQTTEPSTAS